MKSWATTSAVVCVSLISIFAFQASAEITPEMILGIWLLDSDDGGEIIDSFDNGFVGAIFGNPELVDGVFDGALEFAAPDYTEVAEDPRLDVGDQLTLVFWANGKAPQTWKRIIDKNREETGRLGWEIQIGDAPNFGMRIDTDAAENQNYYANGVLDGTWHHTAFVLDNGSIKVYTDGELTLDTTYQHGDGFATTDQLQIGTAGFAGALDDVGLFNVPLEEDDIQDIMNDGLTEATGVLAVSVANKLTTTWGSIKE